MAASDIGLLFKNQADGKDALGTLEQFRKEVKKVDDAARKRATGLERYAAGAGAFAEQVASLRDNVQVWSRAVVAGILRRSSGGQRQRLRPFFA